MTHEIIFENWIPGPMPSEGNKTGKVTKFFRQAGTREVKDSYLISDWDCVCRLQFLRCDKCNQVTQFLPSWNGLKCQHCSHFLNYAAFSELTEA